MTKPSSKPVPPMDPDEREAIARRLPRPHRTVLALYDIAPLLARPIDRPRLRLLFDLLLPDTPFEKASEAIDDLHHMHLRGFCIPAFNDWNSERPDIARARHVLSRLRHAFGSELPDPGNEQDAIDHMLRLLGYTVLPLAKRKG